MKYYMFKQQTLIIGDQICKNPPHTHTLTGHSFHCQSIALSISKLTTTDTLSKVNRSAFTGTVFWGMSGVH